MGSSSFEIISKTVDILVSLDAGHRGLQSGIAALNHIK
jgi:hypothetical protein